MAEKRGSKKRLSDEDINKLENLIWKYGFEGRTMTWESLAEESGSYVSPYHARRRKKWADDFRTRYTSPSGHKVESMSFGSQASAPVLTV
ncbi:hypothetical protein BJ878DRAFT_513884 [Calycina marina]|uniref:Uncharacterized protein n=1 Tax=Calycina marina TaxID=1763456 RepID=A0A9P8CDM1_9HELO|nr:hypothetical protein BJ878DRAFT_513884 [Calycina marina]